MDRIYFLKYTFFKGGAGKYSIDTQGNDPKGEQRIEMFKRSERDLWIERYQHVKKSDIHHSNLKSFTTQSLESGVITRLTDEQMEKIINGI